MIVWEGSAGTELALRHILNAPETEGQDLSILVILDMTTSAARQVLMLLNSGFRAQLSLQRHDDLEADIISFCAAKRDRSASSVILQHLLPLVSTRSHSVVIHAALLAHRRITVQQFARLNGSSVRTLQWTQRNAHMIPAKLLLGWMVSLHSLWRLEALGWNAKRTWSTGGFPNHDAWAQYIARHAGASPARLLSNGGFARLLAHCGQAIAVSPSRAPTGDFGPY